MIQNEFNTNQQFMLTTGLQIDDVAWLMGRTQTVQYSNTAGSLQFESNMINYTMQVFQGAVAQPPITLQTGVILFNVPTSEYSLGNNYLHPISSSNNSFLQEGSAAPVSYVYSIEKIPMSDGNFVRIVAVPTIRMMTTTVGTGSYVEFYLPLLVNGSNLGLSQSVTLIGQTINQYLQSNVTKVQFTMSFPQASGGFNSGFFPFQSTTKTVTFTSSSTVEMYEGKVSVSIGLYG